jgi:hypothetical protein
LTPEVIPTHGSDVLVASDDGAMIDVQYQAVTTKGWRLGVNARDCAL